MAWSLPGSWALAGAPAGRRALLVAAPGSEAKGAARRSYWQGFPAAKRVAHLEASSWLKGGALWLVNF